ncbi:hypothetical protein [Candidatus Rhabdochlamydia porcellionis]|nr:hypothetical protein [Candidatus Rhabdochlamydia porcellionis]
MLKKIEFMSMKVGLMNIFKGRMREHPEGKKRMVCIRKSLSQRKFYSS